ncbi:MAG: hypothetical protein KC427_01730 [Sulfurovum sp.]|uniref:hypothetical protein n=1 Tax=Sulfurovum sp. TaxID=1969726 RepID=UPI0028683A2B|nr:hypothetical protein [Sulfurovum sp.]MCO4844721.1 hypothetical protein [Sulfurovum sp.]
MTSATSPSSMIKALENNPIPRGIFYQAEGITFEEHLRGDEKRALFSLTHDLKNIQELFNEY